MLGLFGGHQRRGGAPINVSVCDQFANRGPAFAALEAAAMMRLHSLGIVRTCLDGGAHALAVQGSFETPQSCSMRACRKY